jgi:glycosyltransferase involved in cell wall biosynthesis
MRLLIVTQSIDRNDPVLGFFHAWIAGLASEFQSIEAVCLKEGKHELPSSVHVHSLGKEKGRRSRMAYALAFMGYAWDLRHAYDCVFIHMNEEYLLLGGILWKLLGKRVVLWRNHRRGSWRTDVAMILAANVCYTSADAYVARFHHGVQMPVGVDTDLFTPASNLSNPSGVLFLGRLDPVKRVEEFVNALLIAVRHGARYTAAVYGDPTDPQSTYAERVRRHAAPLVERKLLSFLPAVSNFEAAGVYRTYAIYVNLTPSGSFDKTIIEAMASGCVVVCSNNAVRNILPNELMTDGTPESVARAIGFALTMSVAERAEIARASRAYAIEKHSLQLLIGKLVRILQA